MIDDRRLRTHLGCVRIVGTLSYADYDMVLELHARRADPERPQALCGQAAAHVCPPHAESLLEKGKAARVPAGCLGWTPSGIELRIRGLGQGRVVGHGEPDFTAGGAAAGSADRGGVVGLEVRGVR